jgi:abortive infection bacteriophage resistance protein
MNQQPPVPFTKPWFDYPDQVKVLESRGLALSDPAAAATFLSHVNYYRFSGYCLAFEQSRHQFVKGTTFEQVRQSYEFDLTIRDLLSDSLEIVEVDLRTSVANHFGRKHGAFGHTHSATFYSGFSHAEWLQRLREEATRSSERFVVHFKRNYLEFPDLPIWVATEIMSLGSLSKMYSGMDRADQKAIASRYGLQPMILKSWMHHLLYIRNLCAHHSRLWDRIWSIKPDLPAGNAWGTKELSGNDRLACTLLILYRMLLKCPAIGTFAASWKARVEQVIAAPPAAPKALFHMGMIPPLAANSLWK